MSSPLRPHAPQLLPSTPEAPRASAQPESASTAASSPGPQTPTSADGPEPGPYGAPRRRRIGRDVGAASSASPSPSPPPQDAPDSPTQRRPSTELSAHAFGLRMAYLVQSQPRLTPAPRRPSSRALRAIGQQFTAQMARTVGPAHADVRALHAEAEASDVETDSNYEMQTLLGAALHSEMAPLPYTQPQYILSVLQGIQMGLQGNWAPIDDEWATLDDALGDVLAPAWHNPATVALAHVDAWYAALPAAAAIALTPEEADAHNCPISLQPFEALDYPVGVVTGDVLHVFEAHDLLTWMIASVEQVLAEDPYTEATPTHPLSRAPLHLEDVRRVFVPTRNASEVALQSPSES